MGLQQPTALENADEDIAEHAIEWFAVNDGVPIGGVCLRFGQTDAERLRQPLIRRQRGPTLRLGLTHGSQHAPDGL